MHDLLHSIRESKRSLAILIDPEKVSIKQFDEVLYRVAKLVEQSKKQLNVQTFYLFIGGSTMQDIDLDKWIIDLRNKTILPLLLFPGSYEQLSDHAHGLLFLNLLSGNNPQYLIGQQRQAAGKLKDSPLQIIPTAYLLIDGGTVSAVQRVSQTEPIPQQDVLTIVDTAYAGQLMGNKLVYLEAGSGAQTPVSHEIIKAVSSQINIPIIVGGGIKNFNAMEKAYMAGARVLVVGTAIENDAFKYDTILSI